MAFCGGLPVFPIFKSDILLGICVPPKHFQQLTKADILLFRIFGGRFFVDVSSALLYRVHCTSDVRLSRYIVS